MAICVPVRDEEQRLPRLFEALDLLGGVMVSPVHVCLLLDGCEDASAALATNYRQRTRHTVHIAETARSTPNAGRARDRAMRLGIDALGVAGGILLTTDADSWPRHDWLSAMQSGLDHADIVVGHVLRAGGEANDHQSRIDRYYNDLFALRRVIDPVPWEASATHHHCSGANMAMRVDTYLALGGFSPLPHGEDAQLVDDAARAGLRVRRDAASVVHTSSRRSGRARHGLADALDQLDRFGLVAVEVAHPADQAWQYRAQATARRLFGTGEFGELGALIGLSHDHLLGVARDCPNAEAFAMRAVPVPPGGMRSVSFPAAEACLAAMIAADRPMCAA